MDKNTTCCFTGHREIPIDKWMETRAKLRAVIERLIEEGYHDFVAGGALGFDTMAATEIIRFKRLYDFVTLTVVSPYAGQADAFSSEDRQIFETIKNLSDNFIILRQNYQKGCMMERNKKMADMSSICVAYMKDENSGTGNTVKYALKNHLKVINLYVGDDEKEDITLYDFL